MKYRVEVKLDDVTLRTFLVDADSPAHAETLALSMARVHCRVESVETPDYAGARRELGRDATWPDVHALAHQRLRERQEVAS